MKQQVFAKVIGCDLDEAGYTRLLHILAGHDGKDVCVTVERKRKKRSLNQNQYYWGVVVPMCRQLLTDFGNEVDDEETHAFLKEHIGKLTASVHDGKSRKAIVKSSASLSTTEFEQYILRIIVWAATENVIIPSPNQELEAPLEAYLTA